MVINAARPWLSSADIDTGIRWPSELAKILDKAKFGILCLTPKSLHSEWLLYEAGALSKSITGSYVCPLLIDLSPAEVAWPLAQFQMCRTDLNGIRKLVETMNVALAENRLQDAQLAQTFSLLWPNLEQKLNAIPGDDTVEKPARDPQEIAEETLTLVRALNVRSARIRESTVRTIIEIIDKVHTNPHAENFHRDVAEGLINTLSSAGSKVIGMHGWHSILDHSQIVYDVAVTTRSGVRKFRLESGNSASEFVSNVIAAMTRTGLIAP